MYSNRPSPLSASRSIGIPSPHRSCRAVGQQNAEKRYWLEKVEAGQVTPHPPARAAQVSVLTHKKFEFLGAI